MSKKLSIDLDAAAVFDIFSIGEIKTIRLEDGYKREKALAAVEALWNALEKQLGPQGLQKIYQSQEYSNLFKANEETFDAVDLAEKNLISAYEVAQLNNKRYVCKRALQEKFFEGELDEVKSGV